MKAKADSDLPMGQVKASVTSVRCSSFATERYAHVQSLVDIAMTTKSSVVIIGLCPRHLAQKDWYLYGFLRKDV